MEKKQQQFSVGYFLVAFFVLLMIQNYFASPHTQTITYSQFKLLVTKGLVTNLVVGEKAIRGDIKAEGLKEVFSPEKLTQLVTTRKRIIPSSPYEWRIPL